MKKILCLLTVLCVILAVAACHKADKPDSSSLSGGDSSSTSSSGDSSSSGGDRLNDLGLAIANTGDNYKYKYAIAERDPSGETRTYEGEFYYDGGILKFDVYDDENNARTDYLYYDFDSDSYSYYAQNADGSYTIVPDTDADFDNYSVNVSLVYPDFLSFESFAYVSENTFEAKADALTDQADAFLGGTADGEVYAGFTVTISGEYLSSVKITSEITDNGISYYCTYTVTFSDCGNVNLTLPAVTEPEPDPQPQTGSISAANAAEDNAVVTVTGTIFGLVGNNFYLTDGEAGIYIYPGSKALGYATGDKITLTGTKTTFNGLIEIKDITEHSKVSSNNYIVPAVLGDLSSIDKYLSMNVSFGALTVKTAPSWTASTKNDVKYTVTDGSNSCTLFISKNISTEKKSELYAALKNVKANDTIFVNNAAIGRYNSYQIAVTESTVISTKEPEITAIESESETLTVYQGTELTAIAAKLNVYKKYDNGTTKPIDSAELTLVSDDYDANILAEYVVKVQWESFECEVIVTVAERPAAVTKISYSDTKILADVKNEKGFGTMPATGNAKALVIPVAFTDYKAPSGMKERLNEAFFGTSEQAGWESLYSYYYKTSYGKLTISGTVTDVYETKQKASYYENIYLNDETAMPEYEIIKGALEAFNDKIDYSEYDGDGDGYIDAIYIVYTAPVDYDNGDFWWAYTSEYYSETEEKYDGVEADFYTFLGYDFFDDQLACGKTVKSNTETIIHESGHILGITDYYDYDDKKGPHGGIGGGDMMDANVGDNNPFTKILLGWADASLVRDSAEITLSSFGSTGECIILAKDWNGSAFCEYYVIDYYTPDGLNALEKGYSGLFSVEGIRIYHVDATLASGADEAGIWDMYKNNNSDTDDKLLALVQASGKNNIATSGSYSSDSDLYAAGATVSGLKWYDGTSVGFTVTVSSIANGSATLSIVFN